jgi:hypothetical protein
MDKDKEIAELRGRLAALEAVSNRTGIHSPNPKSPRRRRLLIGVGVVAGLFVALFLYAAATAPRTVGELAEMYKQNCIRDKGSGNWQASSGISLEKFCEASGDYQALMEDKKRHPEAY